MSLVIKNNSFGLLPTEIILEKIKLNNGLYFIHNHLNGFSYNKLEDLVEEGLLEVQDMSYTTWYFKRKLIKFYIK